MCTFLAIPYLFRTERQIPQKTRKTFPETVDQEPLSNHSDMLTLFTDISKPIAKSEQTFFGKIFQDKDVVLQTDFGLKKLAYDEDQKRYILDFLPGELQNFDVFIDGEKVSSSYGFAQFPNILCDTIRSKDGSVRYSTDPSVYAGSTDIVPFISEQECITEKQPSLPPVLFFFKSDKELPSGSHTLVIKSQDVLWTFNFDTADTTSNIKNESKSVTIASPTSINPSLYQIGDTCLAGYHYPKSVMPIPLANISDYEKFLLYAPKNEYDRKNFNEQRVIKIRFGNTFFDLDLPPADMFYKPIEKVKYLHVVSHLFIPYESMIFSGGESASFWKGPENPNLYPQEYLELVPVGSSGEVHFNQKIPFQTSASSGCDG